MTFQELFPQFTSGPTKTLDELYLSHAEDLISLANADENHHLFFIRMKPWECSYNRTNIYHLPSYCGIEENIIRELYKPFLLTYIDICRAGARDVDDPNDRAPCYGYINAAPFYKAKFYLDAWIVVKGDKEAAFLQSETGQQDIRSKFIWDIDLSITKFDPNEARHHHFRSTKLYRIFPDKFTKPLIVGFHNKI